MFDSMQAALAFTRAEEGGYSSDARDGGNWTSGTCGKGQMIGSNMGVGAPCLVEYNARHQLGLSMSPATMEGLSTDLYQSIAVDEYWSLLPCDSLPPGLAIMVFDYAWNRGNGNSIHELQEALGVTMDGDYGVRSAAAMRRVSNIPTFIERLGMVQQQHYRSLLSFPVYGRGWLARTVRRQTAALDFFTNHSA